MRAHPDEVVVQVAGMWLMEVLLRWTPTGAAAAAAAAAGVASGGASSKSSRHSSCPIHLSSRPFCPQDSTASLVLDDTKGMFS
eukprot:COSAG02_NODE_1295_length_13400_cov_5.691828_18_plen_83_part_00